MNGDTKTALRLTRAQRSHLEYALRNAERAKTFIQSPDIAVGRLGKVATTTLHFTRADGATFYAINKDVGSDLVGLDNAIKTLRAALGYD